LSVADRSVVRIEKKPASCWRYEELAGEFAAVWVGAGAASWLFLLLGFGLGEAAFQGFHHVDDASWFGFFFGDYFPAFLFGFD
jgi:hypothetical protein